MISAPATHAESPGNWLQCQCMRDEVSKPRRQRLTKQQHVRHAREHNGLLSAGDGPDLRAADFIRRERCHMPERRRHVSVSDEGVRVKAGLRPGDILVTAGVQFLQDGMKVRVPKGAMAEVVQADGSASR